jgi:hypothetical protein
MQGRVTVFVAWRERAVAEKPVCEQAVNKDPKLQEEIALRESRTLPDAP